MKKLAKVLALVLALAMVLSAFGCATDTTKPADTETTQPADTATTEPEGESNVNVDESYNDMTSEELYELAKAEGGDINIYSISSRMQKTCDKFNEAYPELNAVAYDMDQDEAVSKIKIEAETGNINADLLQGKDCAGEIYYDFYPLGYLETYYPTDICSHIDDNLEKYGMPFYSSFNFWYYNTKAFPDACPVTNWWDIVEIDEATGKQKYNIVTKEIGSESTYIAFFSMFILNADQMEAAYKEKYGTDIEYTYEAFDGLPENNAGVEFYYRFSQLKLTFISDGDEVVEAVQNSTAASPTLGFCSAGKISNRDDNGWDVDWVTGLTPYTTVQNTNYLYVVTGCDNPAGVRLFVRFLMGEADGQGDGFSPFTKQGNWSVRDDYTNENNPFGLDGAGAIVSDISGIYEIYPSAQDFWIYSYSKSPNKG